jgi:hypothetical protein
MGHRFETIAVRTRKTAPPADVKPTSGQWITGFVHSELDCPHQIEPTCFEIFDVSLQNGIPLKVQWEEGVLVRPKQDSQLVVHLTLRRFASFSLSEHHLS